MVPIALTKREARLAAGFTGAREGFGITSFAADYYSDDAPTFIGLDEYNNPSEPDERALAKLLVREYPEYFG